MTVDAPRAKPRATETHGPELHCPELHGHGLVHRLFSYGTLRQADVQQSLFGRAVDSTPDALPGYRLDWVTITDPDVIATSGSDRHPIITRGEPTESVTGARLELSEADLARADAYEVDDYARVSVVLASGVDAWVYVAARP